jgi:uncharacterized protein YdaT
VPWSIDYFPASMRRLPPAVRAKAVEIANALLADGHPEGQAIRIAIARARQWAQRRGIAEGQADSGYGALHDIR